ncbi:MAG: chromosome segregation SMC family protein [Thermovirgaceae bacterium]|nr:chromosome segregation SMC family protein [Thermovirgaceae bacterium]
MFIGRIHLKGFKSFGGSHEIALSRNFTAVVGPNGSGKSNILDALRWALGDGHPGRLRIVRQQDLLFQGSISLPPATSSEVLVHLRDGDRVCGLRRRYSQEDGSTIAVDGSKVRLADLDAIKREWHLEGDRFAFISQGEVSDVIQQRPLQRRTHLESIFGIDLYRRQREEANQRLDAASLEMQRLMTLRSELQIRKETIADSVIRARQAKAIMDVLERERSLLYWIRRARAEAIHDAIRQEIVLIEDRRGTARLWASGWRRAVADEGVRIQNLARDRGEALESVSSQGRHIGEARRELFSLGAVLRGTIERKREFSKDLSIEKDRFGEIDSRREGAEADFKRAAEEEKTAAGAFNAESEKWEAYQRSVEEHSDRIRAFREEVAACEAGLEGARARGSSLGRAVLEASGSLSRVVAKEKEAGRALEDLEVLLSSIRREESEAGQKHRGAYASYQQAAAAKQALLRDLSAVEGEAESLRETVFSRVYPSPVQHLLAAVRLGRLEASPRPLVDVITCPEELTTAMESFLGARQFLLLVRDIEEAGRCIGHLKSKSAGRATFLPFESSKKRQPAQGLSMEREGIVGLAADLVGMEKEWESCVLHVLGDLLVVRSFEVGRDLAREGFRGPIVTLDGDVFQPGGTISGGKAAKAPGALEMKRLLAGKETAADRIRGEQNRLEKEISLLQAEEREASEESRRIFEERKRREEEARVLVSEAAAAGREAGHARERIRKILSELSSCGKEQLAGITKLDELRDRVQERVDTALEVSLVKVLEERRSRADLAAERLGTADRMLSMIGEEKKRALDRISSLEKGLAEASSSAALTLERLKKLGNDYFGIWKNLGRAASRLESLEKRYSAALSVQNRVMERSASSAGRLESLVEKIRQAHHRAESAEAEISESVDMWEERFPYPGNGNVDTRDHDRIRRRVREMEKGLREVGDVDIGVLSEDTSLTERLSFLGEQLRDVGGGIDELRRLIEETDRQAGALFSTSLKKIDKRFCSLFQRLFGGGEAHLKLADEGLAWDTGVDVIARPPGKRPQHLAQLSGGEQSLSAISLLFAAMEVAGVPLAVLDEVDSSLDEVNLRRFSDLAREYSKSMQLICMTHRRATMERADLMYGVTMAEPGLSQVVGVRLEDWD